MPNSTPPPKLDFQSTKNNLGINLYDKILELRKFEIENFWKRTLFFWGTLAVVLAGYFKSDLGERYLVFISFVGVLYSVIFSLSIRGSKYWQEHWEMVAIQYEEDLNFDLLHHEAKDYINNHNKKNHLTYPLRFSVSKLTMLLSDITVLLWIMFWAKDVWHLLHYKQYNIDLSSLFILGTCLFHIVLIIYITLFFKYGNVYYKKK